MSKKTGIQIFSLSFLDLIFCAMAGVLVLYVIEDPPQPSEAVPDRPPRSILVEFEDTAGLIAYEVELINGKKKTIRGNSTRKSGQWLFATNPCSARLRMDEPLEDDAKLMVTITDLDPRISLTGGRIPMRITIVAPDSFQFSANCYQTKTVDLVPSEFQYVFDIK